MPVIYSGLHRLAHRYMSLEHPGHPLQTTELVNEAYLRLVHVWWVDCGRDGRGGEGFIRHCHARLEDGQGMALAGTQTGEAGKRLESGSIALGKMEHRLGL